MKRRTRSAARRRAEKPRVDSSSMLKAVLVAEGFDPDNIMDEYQFASKARTKDIPDYLVKAFGLPRLWRFDVVIVRPRIAIEVQGGIWQGGAHSRGSGHLNDMDKLNCAHSLGWTVYQCAADPDRMISLARLLADNANYSTLMEIKNNDQEEN